MLYPVGKALSAAVCRVFGRWKVVGRENVPAEGGLLLCGNHISYIDPPALGGGAPRPVHFMAKSELFKVPLLGFLIKHVGAFPVKRGTADRTALRQAIEYLKNGEVVGMFPEGSRSLDGKLQEPEPGVGMIVLRAKVPVVPVALVDTDKLLPPHSFFFKFSRITVAYGKPISFDDLYDQRGREAVEEACKRIMSGIAALLEEQRTRTNA